MPDRTASGLRGAPITDVGERPGLVELMRSDIDRYSYMLDLDGTAALPREIKPLKVVRAVLMCQGLQASLVHRVGHALSVWKPSGIALNVLRIALRLVHWMANRVVESATGISISEHAVIGRGLYIGHFGGVIVGVVHSATTATSAMASHSDARGAAGRPVGRRWATASGSGRVPSSSVASRSARTP